MDWSSLQGMTVAELYKQHQVRDAAVQKLRDEQRAIHDVICVREAEAFRPADPRLAQKLGLDNEESILAALKALGRESKERLKDLLSKLNSEGK